MPIVSAKKMLVDAAQGGYAVGAFNVTNLIQMEAVIETAVSRRAPVIVQTSVTPAKFLRPEVLVAAYRALAGPAPVPVCLHLDHCTDAAYAKRCAELGYTNVMYDGSKLDFDENVRITREVVEYCHALGDITVEGELGTVSGVEDQVRVAENEAELCDPARSREFVERSGVDLFAPAIGTAHGVYMTENPKIDFDRFEKIQQLVNGQGILAPLIVHGGTGLKPEVVKRLVALGGAKFNVSTDLKHAWIDATYDYIAAHRTEYNPGKIDIAAKQAVVERVNTGSICSAAPAGWTQRRTSHDAGHSSIPVRSGRSDRRHRTRRAPGGLQPDLCRVRLGRRVGCGRVPPVASGRRRQGTHDALPEHERLRSPRAAGRGAGSDPAAPPAQDGCVRRADRERCLPLRPGVRRIMEEAAALGLTLGICTTSNERAAGAITRTLLAGIPLAFVLAGDVVKAKKPDPAIYQLALEKSGLEAGQCVVFEDSHIGVRAAKAAGMNVVATANLYTQHEDLSMADLGVDCLGDPDGPHSDGWPTRPRSRWRRLHPCPRSGRVVGRALV
jgi:tagatose 1,6-diphosphate aldolase GatY/KbaY